MKRKLFLGFTVLAATLTLASCGKEENPLEGLEGTYDATIWVSEVEGVTDLTKKQIDAFEEKYPGVVINATIEGQSEADSSTLMISDVESGADIYCFAQDQLARLVQAGALNKLGVKASETVKELNDAGSVKAATVNGSLYCYPLTSDNGYFMFYDKRYIKEESLDSLEAIIADCEAAKKNFSYELETNTWYNAGWFFATGCTSTWTTDENGKFTSVNDDFNSDKGVIALKGMQKLLSSSSYVCSSNGADFAAAVPSAVVITGTWATETIKGILGENMGATDLPSFTVDGKSYHLGSFSGNKLMGVKPQTDANKAAVLQQLALWLTGEECQTERFEEVSWGPSNLEAQKSDAVQSDVALKALALQSQYAIPQGQIHGSWWDIGKTYATAAKDAKNDADLKAALEAYEAAINGLFSMSEDEKNAFSVIGNVNGTSWDTDLEMEEISKDVWQSKVAYAMTTKTEFKCRQGKAWTVAFGTWDATKDLANQPNFVVTTAGTYKVKLTLTRDANGAIVSGTVELVPAN